MEKYFKIILLSLLPLFTLCFTSCGDDKEKDEPANPSIVGTWRYDYDADYGEYTLYIFNADGKFQTIGYYHNEVVGADGGVYTINGDSITLIINSTGEVVTLKIVYLSDEDLYLGDEDEVDHFYRVK